MLGTGYFTGVRGASLVRNWELLGAGKNLATEVLTAFLLDDSYPVSSLNYSACGVVIWGSHVGMETHLGWEPVMEHKPLFLCKESEGEKVHETQVYVSYQW